MAKKYMCFIWEPVKIIEILDGVICLLKNEGINEGINEAGSYEDGIRYIQG